MRARYTLLASTLLSSACTFRSTETAAPPSPEDSCIYAHDGVCDEPRNCALGSDSSDCDQACAQDYSPALAAACDYDKPIAEAPLADPGSHGAGGPAGHWEGSITAVGPEGVDQLIDRYYRMYVPPTYDPAKPSPLLYVMGGFRVDNHSLASYTELNRLADQQGIIIAYLQAHWLDYGQNGWVYQWYVYPNNWSPSLWPNCPDVDFIRKLSEQLKSQYNIDRTRIFTSGHSRGGAESVIVAFEAPDLIAGFLSESGFTGVNNYATRIQTLNPSRKVTGVLVHGVADSDVPVSQSDITRDAMVNSGHIEGEHFLYFRLEGVTHQWQPQYNAQAWTFMTQHPLPLEMAAP